MKITASGGTDAANMVLFWPDNLPDEAESMLKEDPIGLVENLRNQGRLIWFPCNSDGDYTVAIYLESEIPDDLFVYCIEEEQIPQLSVWGIGYFGGMEYLFKCDSSFLKRYPHMCEPISIPDGTYSARVYQTDIPESVYELWLEQQSGARAKRLWDMHGWIAAIAAASVPFALIGLCLVSLKEWFVIAALSAMFVTLALSMTRNEWYITVSRARDAYGEQHPAYVVRLERCLGGGLGGEPLHKES